MPSTAKMVKTSQRAKPNQTIVEDTSETPRDTKASDAAVAEVINPKGTISFKFGDRVYTYKRKRVESVQFRLALQKREDVAAIEWLLGPIQFSQFLDEHTDEDGCTTAEVYGEFIDAVFEELGTGN